ncbi:MAG: hypothetical protein J7L66_05395 [Anaerolineaceae bacterium]|nr:hypothetical protein [Anaerolineaceae bacterium]
MPLLCQINISINAASRHKGAISRCSQRAIPISSGGYYGQSDMPLPNQQIF